MAKPKNKNKKLTRESLDDRESKGLITLPRHMTMTIREAVLALQNNEIRMVSESKGVVTSKATYPPELVNAMRGIFPAGKVYRFELHASGIIASNGAGVFNTRVAWDPSITSFGEYSALSALFDEVKALNARVDITSAFGPTSTAIVVMCVIGPDNDETSGSAPNFSVVQRLAESEYFHIYTMAGKPGVFTKSHTITDRPWAAVATPGGAAGTPSGAIGQFSISHIIATTANINVLFWALKPVFAFRHRA